jgi:hypothetical protein
LVSDNDRLLKERPLPSDSSASGGAAILLLAESQQALAAARVLEAAGLPFTVTPDLAAALRQRLVFVPLDERSLHLGGQRREALRSYVAAGGLLVLQMPAGDPWTELTGVQRARPARSRRRMVFRAQSDAGFQHLEQAEELEIPLASPRVRECIWTAGLRPAPGMDVEVLADFPDTSEAAIVRRHIGAGSIYVIGAHLRDLTVRPQAGRGFDAQRVSNGYEPAADVWPLIFRAWYQRSGTAWLRLRTAPGRARAVFLLSHPMDSDGDPARAEALAAQEAASGLRATWFFQTGNSAGSASFFDARKRALARRLRQSGHEVASLSVSASPAFAELPLGTGRESPRDYHPQTDPAGRLRGATLLGETGVSQALLEDALSQRVAGFRAPDYAYPQALDSALRRAGYAYDSSLSANASLTHLPFFMLEWRALAREAPILELPVTFAAGQEPPPKDMLAVMRKIADHEGWIVWSASPDAGRAPAGLLAEVLAAVPKDYARLTMSEAARFWRARSRARFWVYPDGGAKRLRLRLDIPEGAPGLAFACSGQLRSCASPDRSAKISCSGDILTVDAARPGRIDIRISLR